MKGIYGIMLNSRSDHNTTQVVNELKKCEIFE